MMHSLRRYLIAGLLIWIPLGVTLLVIEFLVDLMDQSLRLVPTALLPENLFGAHIPGLGIVLTAVIVLGTGVVVTNLLGRQLLDLGEALLQRIPLVRSIYAAVKQLTESLFSGSGKSFRKVVLIEYPRPGLYSLAFRTGDAAAEIHAKTGKDMVHVFVPTTPNPTSGFVLLVPRTEVIELDMTADEGLKLILSIGVVVPESRKEALLDRYPAS